MYNKVIDMISKSSKIGVFMHINPDADSIGSSIALKLALEKLGKEVVLFCSEDIHENYSFMNIEKHYKNITSEKKFDLAILLDCPSYNRIDSYNHFTKIKNKIVIDHHLNNVIKADAKIVDIKSGCTGVLIYRLIKMMDIRFDKDICTCIYSAIVSDTGSFAYNNVTPEIFKISAECLENGIDNSQISYYLMTRKTRKQLKNFQEIISKFEFHNDIAICLIEYDFIKNSGNDSFDTFSALKFIDGVEGIKLFVLMTERNKNTFNISFRSRYIDTTIISTQFDGGGHASASGCVISGSGENIKSLLLSKAKDVING